MGSGEAILLLEDDTFTGRMMELQFRKHGFQISLAANGEEGLKLFAEHKFNLVITDMMMPGLSGLEVVSHIRKTHSRKELPIILLTAISDVKSIMDGFERGANDFLGKTNEFAIVLAKVNHHLEVNRLYRMVRQNKQSTMLRSSNDAPWSWHLTRDEMGFSARFRVLLGFPPKVLDENSQVELGKSSQEWFKRIHAEDLERVQAGLDAHFKRRKGQFEADYRLRHHGGHFFWVHSFGMASFSREGEAVRMVGCTTALEGAESLLARTRFNMDALHSFAGSLASEQRNQLEKILATFENCSDRK